MSSKAQKTRQYIVEKTSVVFNAKGYAGTSLNDLTEATGLTKGSIYGNFENKDEVALAVFDHNFGKIVAHLKSKMAKKTSVIGKLQVYPETYKHFLSLPFLKAGCPLLNTAMEADDTHPQLRKKALDALTLWKNSVEQLIHTGIANKEIKPQVNAPAFAAVLMALIEGGVMQAKLTGKSTGLQYTMNHLEKTINELKR
ncbi:MAG TPA: TetR/AcrR family transcriptional regulator [Flavobacteriales bacterium]|nr:TetR/AcrR family transcriptional regulator [Flavobacteriales bacterium]